jgi:hypothetical protein
MQARQVGSIGDASLNKLMCAKIFDFAGGVHKTEFDRQSILSL